MEPGQDRAEWAAYMRQYMQDPERREKKRERDRAYKQRKREEQMSDHRASAVPRAPSNRRVIEQMKRWGWTTGRQDGRWMTMHGPPIGEMSGITLAVRPGSQHDANPTTIFHEIYNLTTNGDANSFWEGPPEVWQDMLRQARERSEKARAAAKEAELARAAQVAREREWEAIRIEGERQAEAARAEAAKREVKEMESKRKTGKGIRTSDIRASDVLDCLATNDRPMNIQAVGRRMGLDMDNETNVRDVGNRLAYLYSKGLAERVMAGTYRALGSGTATSGRIEHHVDRKNTHEPERVSPDRTIFNPITIEPIEDSIEAVLDLLLPNGFKASHLKFIAPWIDATKQMLNEVVSST